MLKDKIERVGLCSSIKSIEIVMAVTKERVNLVAQTISSCSFGSMVSPDH